MNQTGKIIKIATWVFWGTITIVFIVSFLRFVVGGSEDDWICVNNEWVKHGVPSASMPEAGCGDSITKSVPGSDSDKPELPELTSDVDSDHEEKNEIIQNYEILSSEAIQEIISNGVDWFKESQEKTGHFRYEYMPLSGAYSNDDNIVRQTGALYILGEILIRDKKNKYDLKDNIEKAINYFKDNTRLGEMNGYDFRCIARPYNNTCSLGATSLGLIGVLDLIEARPELRNKYVDLVSDYLNFILAMKREGAGFSDSYALYEIETPLDKESSFSNGEAFLALARYYRLTQESEVEKVIDEAFEYFNDYYGSAHDFNFYLWGMVAIKDLYDDDPQQSYYDFVKDYTDWRIAGYKSRRDTKYNKCAYIEGVISAYSVLEPSLIQEENDFYLEEINFWLSKSAGLQVKIGGFVDLMFGNEFYSVNLVNPSRAWGGFLTGLDKPLQRIDFTQHCLSAYLQKLADIDGEKL